MTRRFRRVLLATLAAAAPQAAIAQPAFPTPAVDGSVESLRADIQKNLAREVKFRVAARNKAAALEPC